MPDATDQVRKRFNKSRGSIVLVVTCTVLLSVFQFGQAEESAERRRVDIMLGDYRFEPTVTGLFVGHNVAIALTNTDSLTPHNFSVHFAEANLDVDVDIGPKRTVVINMTPQRREATSSSVTRRSRSCGVTASAAW